ncbi:hypothetical protein cyc_03045 [Cyclospora cayetanensis]|uniref:RING-type domain-containing protein n=1 Tax=Cyclospora cayetanensis TaxID=88456 RepID=A0A1D3D768_9EIME|nr:hypothetical protein cyc_03045 [Cyclospora cayetanensis]
MPPEVLQAWGSPTKISGSTCDVLAPQSLVEQVTCPICLEVLSQPLLTPCGHVGCGVCMILTVRSRGRCPLCNCSISNPRVLQPFLSKCILQQLQQLQERQPEEEHAAQQEQPREAVQRQQTFEGTEVLQLLQQLQRQQQEEEEEQVLLQQEDSDLLIADVGSQLPLDQAESPRLQLQQHEGSEQESLDEELQRIHPFCFSEAQTMRGAKVLQRLIELEERREEHRNATSDRQEASQQELLGSYLDRFSQTYYTVNLKQRGQRGAAETYPAQKDFSGGAVGDGQEGGLQGGQWLGSLLNWQPFGVELMQRASFYNRLLVRCSACRKVIPIARDGQRLTKLMGRLLWQSFVYWMKATAVDPLEAESQEEQEARAHLESLQQDLTRVQQQLNAARRGHMEAVQRHEASCKRRLVKCACCLKYITLEHAETFRDWPTAEQQQQEGLVIVQSDTLEPLAASGDSAATTTNITTQEAAAATSTGTTTQEAAAATSTSTTAQEAAAATSTSITAQEAATATTTSITTQEAATATSTSITTQEAATATTTTPIFNAQGTPAEEAQAAPAIRRATQRVRYFPLLEPSAASCLFGFSPAETGGDLSTETEAGVFAPFSPALRHIAHVEQALAYRIETEGFEMHAFECNGYVPICSKKCAVLEPQRLRTELHEALLLLGATWSLGLPLCFLLGIVVSQASQSLLERLQLLFPSVASFIGGVCAGFFKVPVHALSVLRG